MDKTGTITEGKLEVTDIIDNQKLISYLLPKKGNIKIISNTKNNEKSENKLLQIIGSLEVKSEHPISEAVIKYAKSKKIEFLNVEDFVSVSGRGIKGSILNKMYFAGNILFMKENNIEVYDNIDFISRLYSEGKTLLYVSNEKELIGIVAIADTVKKSSKFAIEQMKKNKLDVIMVTGDNSIVANTIAKQVGIEKVVSDVIPQEKSRVVSSLQKNGSKVAFVGDGINDSPSLMMANVGLAIGSGTDIAIDSADIVLMKNNLLDVVNAINLSKAVIKNIKMNLFWAFFYNIISIPIAAGILYPFYEIRLNPMISAAAMSFSSVCVVLNALRLKRFKGFNEKIENKINKSLDKTDVKISESQINNKEKNMKKIIVEGMKCNHCKKSVENVLNTIDGIESVDVNLEKKEVNVETSKEVSNDQIIKAITEEGFEVKEIV